MTCSILPMYTHMLCYVAASLFKGKCWVFEQSNIPGLNYSFAEKNVLNSMDIPVGLVKYDISWFLYGCSEACHYGVSWNGQIDLDPSLGSAFR